MLLISNFDRFATRPISRNCAFTENFGNVNLLLFWKCKGARDTKTTANLIHWRKKSKRRKRRKEAHKGIKLNFDVCDRTGSRFSGLVMRLSTNLFLEFIILHFTFISTVSSIQSNKEICAGIWCVFPIALRTFLLQKEKYLWTRAKFYESKSSPDDSIKNFFSRFVYFLFTKKISEILSKSNLIWMEESRRKELKTVTPNPSNKSFHRFNPFARDLWLLDNSWQFHVLSVYQTFFRRIHECGLGKNDKNSNFIRQNMCKTFLSLKYCSTVEQEWLKSPRLLHLLHIKLLN